MYKRIILSLLLSLSSVAGFEAVRNVEYVYICKGPKSTVYHRSEYCSGLSHCSTKIYKVTLSEAIDMGRRPCKIEYH